MARDAVLAAVDGQRALVTHPWPDGVRIVVRMGLHTGQGVASGGRYTGLAVHRAARVGAVGRGGQILVSQATQTLLEDEEEDLGLTLRDLGEQFLKDLDRPVRLYEVVAEGLPTVGPPSRTAPEPRVDERGRRRRVGMAAIAVVLALVGAAGAALVFRDGEAPVVVAPNSLVRIDTESGVVEDVVPVGRDPGQVVIVGPYVFVTSQKDETLHRLDTRTGDVETSGANATDGALVADGEFLWATSLSRAEVVRIHAESMRATARVPLASDLLFAFVAVGAGSLWISQFPPAAVLRVDLEDHSLERRYDLPYYDALVETTFGAGASWTAVGDELLRIDAGTGQSESVPAGEKAGDPKFGFGSMWAGSAGGSAVWRIDPTTGRTTATVRAGKVTFGLAVGAGSMWVRNYCEGSVSRIDPKTSAVVGTIELGYRPKWLAIGHGHAWVGVSGTNWPELGCDGPVEP